MPKETMHDEATLYDVTVGWETNKYVQVGLQTHDGRPIVDHLTETPGETAEFRSLWGTLDRAGCNRLIRAVRRARDQAYGRDE